MRTKISKRYRGGIIAKKTKRKNYTFFGKKYSTSKKLHRRRHKRVKSRRRKHIMRGGLTNWRREQEEDDEERLRREREEEERLRREREEIKNAEKTRRRMAYGTLNNKYRLAEGWRARWSVADARHYFHGGDPVTITWEWPHSPASDVTAPDVEGEVSYLELYPEQIKQIHKNNAFVDALEYSTFGLYEAILNLKRMMQDGSDEQQEDARKEWDRWRVDRVKALDNLVEGIRKAEPSDATTIHMQVLEESAKRRWDIPPRNWENFSGSRPFLDGTYRYSG
jgi:hypothetical protein